jgi:hypothetical protein
LKISIFVLYSNERNTSTAPYAHHHKSTAEHSRQAIDAATSWAQQAARMMITLKSLPPNNAVKNVQGKECINLKWKPMCTAK